MPEPGGGLPILSSPRAVRRPRYLLASVLFVATFFTATTLGVFWSLATRTDVTTALGPWLGLGTIESVWTDPRHLAVGLSFSLPLLFILLCHELGHYVACRHYDIDATLPFFIPAPVALGTFGAFIRIRAPIRSKKELFDVGIAGPIAGFVALLPFLVVGVALSEPTVIDPVPAGMTPEAILLQPGTSLAMGLVSVGIHGPLPDGAVLNLHPFALAAWVGLLATALNLLPLGQLDGGHILYAVFGPVQRRLAIPIWLALLAAGFFWGGWVFWALIVLVIGLFHPPVRDEERPLDGKRLTLAAVGLVLLVLSFMPVPLRTIGVEADVSPPRPEAPVHETPEFDGSRFIAAIVR